MVKADVAIQKIYQYPDTYVIFFTYECPYCQRAMSLLKENNVTWKGYNINDISGGQDELLRSLNYKRLLDEYNRTHNTVHRTRPFVFYNEKFVGGLSDLQLLLQ